MTKYVLIKRDLYECPKHMGYTGIRDKAGVWDEEYVKADGVDIRGKYDPNELDSYAIPLDAAPEFTKTSFHDLNEGHLRAKISAQRDEFCGNLDGWMKTIGAGITGFQPEAYAVLDMALAELVRKRQAFDVLNKNVGYELSWGEVDGWPDDCQWRVHRRSGGRSDTEWKLVATGETAEEALLNARAAIMRKEAA